MLQGCQQDIQERKIGRIGTPGRGGNLWEGLGDTLKKASVPELREVGKTNWPNLLCRTQWSRDDLDQGSADQPGKSHSLLLRHLYLMGCAETDFASLYIDSSKGWTVILSVGGALGRVRRSPTCK